MAAIFNQYSYVIFSIGFILVLGILLRFLLRMGWGRLLTIMGIFALIAVMGFVVLRPGNSDITSAQEAIDMIENGRPTFLEFFSNYCGACLAQKPLVDRLVKQVQDDYDVLRVDIHTDFGRELRRQFEFAYSPEFVIFDADGVEVWRDHRVPDIENFVLFTELDT